MITARTGFDGCPRSDPGGMIDARMTKSDRDELITALRAMQELCGQCGTGDHAPHVLVIHNFATVLEKTR